MMVLVAVAAAMAGFAIGLVAGRRLRPNGPGIAPAWWAAIGCAAILLVGSALLYTFLSNPSASPRAAVDSHAAQVAQAGGPRIRVKVEMAPALQAQAPPAAPLYVFVRDPVHGGPPLAVKRLQSQLPQLVELTAADAMIADRGITAGEQVEVIARISPSGNPMDQAGDLSGHADYRVGRDGVVDVVIDHVTP